MSPRSDVLVLVLARIYCVAASWYVGGKRVSLDAG
jgi:hypothetical protein